MLELQTISLYHLYCRLQSGSNDNLNQMRKCIHVWNWRRFAIDYWFIINVRSEITLGKACTFYSPQIDLHNSMLCACAQLWYMSHKGKLLYIGNSKLCILQSLTYKNLGLKIEFFEWKDRTTKYFKNFTSISISKFVKPSKK